MRWMIFKIIVFMTMFIFMQGAIVPWLISNNFLPLWADIIVISLVLMMWLAVIDRLSSHVLKIFRKNDEIID